MEAFLLQATIYLIAMVIAVPLASRAGLGSVLGYLLAGIAIGPVLGIAGSEMNNLQHFAEFGVVMMLFLIGLELEPRALWAMRDKLIGLGGLQVVLTMAAVTAIAMGLGRSLQVSLALGMIFALSSTAIVVQTLNEKRLMQTAGGRSAFSVLLTQDIAVIPMLAILPLLAEPATRAALKTDSHHVSSMIDGLPGWGITLITLGAVAATILAGHYLVRPLFRYVHGARLREVNTATALLIVVGIASLMNMVGLSPALGTFLAGVVLANSEFRHELESNIEPFKGLLMGLFFITVGAGVNFHVFLAAPTQILGMVVALVALKAGILYLLARIFRLHGTDRSLFTLGLAQTGEFGFVLVSFAVGQRILPSDLAERVLLVIALSMLITPLLFILHQALVTLRRPREEESAKPDEIDEQQPIIVAGIGRFGQIVNRLVTSSGFQTTVLDNDLRTIQVMRTFGYKGYFGDPTRPELLAAAGIAKARVLVVCLDDPAAVTRLVSYARKIRPDLHIIARAHDREHVFALYRAGANDIVREMFDSSLRAGRYVLENVGLSEFEAAELEKIFFKMDRSMVRDLAQVWKPGVPVEHNAEYIARTRELDAGLEAAIMERFSRSGDSDTRPSEQDTDRPANVGVIHDKNSA